MLCNHNSCFLQYCCRASVLGELVESGCNEPKQSLVLVGPRMLPEAGEVAHFCIVISRCSPSTINQPERLVSVIARLWLEVKPENPIFCLGEGFVATGSQYDSVSGPRLQSLDLGNASWVAMHLGNVGKPQGWRNKSCSKVGCRIRFPEPARHTFQSFV